MRFRLCNCLFLHLLQKTNIYLPQNPFKLQANVTKVEIVQAQTHKRVELVDFKTSSSLHRNSILHWSGDNNNINLLTDELTTEKVQKQPFTPVTGGNSLARNADHFKKLGLSCQNLPSTEANRQKTLNTIKNLSKSKSEFNLSEAVEKESISDRIVKIFKTKTKMNRVEPANFEPTPQSKSENKPNKPNWMKKRISDYFLKRRRSG